MFFRCRDLSIRVHRTRLTDLLESSFECVIVIVIVLYHLSCFSHMTHSTTSRARPYCSEIRMLDCTRPAPSWHHLLAKDVESKASRATFLEPWLLRIDWSITSIYWSSSPQCSVRHADNNRCSLNVLWSRSLTTIPIFLVNRQASLSPVTFPSNHTALKQRRDSEKTPKTGRQDPNESHGRHTGWSVPHNSSSASQLRCREPYTCRVHFGSARFLWASTRSW